MKNGKLLKIILLSGLIFLGIDTSYADSYIMISPDNITEVECPNCDIVDIHVLNSIMNDKKSVIVTATGDGSSHFALRLKSKRCDYKATVQGGKLDIKGDKYIKIFPIDLPPEFESEGSSK